MSNTLMSTYNPLPVSMEKGEGPWLWDSKGNKYLDALAGIAVCALGHAHPTVTQAIQDQAAKLLHTSNIYHIPYQEKLADKLTEITGMEQVFISNSGGEANEAALKLTRLFARKKNISEPQIIVMEKAFHGRTLATLSASGSQKIQAGFEPLVPGFIHVPFNNLAAIENALADNNDVVAIMLEPIQGEGGIQVPDTGYLTGIRKLCDEHNLLMVLDEIQTGIGRTGAFYAFQHENATPDILTTAKALGNGIPIGACLARGKALLFEIGKHGSTFGGNPLACRTALTVLDVIEKENLVNNAAEMGDYLLQGLTDTLSTKPQVQAIRGKGLMIGIELDKPCRDILHIALKNGLLFNVTAEKVLRLLPPLLINQNEADQIIEILDKTIDEFYQK